ncbi:hypothetical protein BE20_14620 [Sorangium cellulosum]|nr:hypothetical protein BE20_14620 [Sorangium cellulosum]
MTAPRAYAASGRPVAVALRARGARVELSIDAGDAGDAGDASGEAVLVDPVWEPAGRRIVEVRRDHTATLRAARSLWRAVSPGSKLSPARSCTTRRTTPGAPWASRCA